MSFATLAKATFLFLLEFPSIAFNTSNATDLCSSSFEGMPLPQISALLRGFALINESVSNRRASVAV